MKFGLTQEQFDYILKTVVSPLKKEGAEVWCYGSRARGDFQKFSDLDLMIISNKDLSKKTSLIQESLVESNFPLKVDLVDFHHFAESYKEGFEKDKILFEE